MDDYTVQTAEKLFNTLNSDFPGFKFSISYSKGYIRFDSQCDQYFLTVHYCLSSDNWYIVITARQILFKGQKTQQIATNLSYEEIREKLVRIALLGF